MKIISALLILCTFGGIIYAHVVDFEPIPLEERYELDRDYFNKTNTDWTREFPSFQEWLDHQERQEERMKEWLVKAFEDIKQSATNFSRELMNPSDDTRASAPDNWNKAERE